MWTSGNHHVLIADLTVTQLVDELRKNEIMRFDGNTERILDLMPRTVAKAHDLNDTDPVTLALLRSLVCYPWLIEAALSGFRQEYVEDLKRREASSALLELMREA